MNGNKDSLGDNRFVESSVLIMRNHSTKYSDLSFLSLEIEAHEALEPITSSNRGQ